MSNIWASVGSSILPQLFVIGLRQNSHVIMEDENFREGEYCHFPSYKKNPNLLVYGLFWHEGMCGLLYIIFISPILCLMPNGHVIIRDEYPCSFFQLKRCCNSLIFCCISDAKAWTDLFISPHHFLLFSWCKTAMLSLLWTLFLLCYLVYLFLFFSLSSFLVRRQTPGLWLDPYFFQTS